MNRYRQTAIREKLAIRARILRGIREFFFQNGYLEVETPYRIPAPIPEAHIDSLASEEYLLHTSPELFMKRLMAAGYERIFQICKCFRKGERGRKHLSEMTMLEWYHVGNNYRDMMEQTEDLLLFLLRYVGRKDSIEYRGRHMDLKKSWQRITVENAFNVYASISIRQALRENRFDEIMGCEIEPQLGHGRPVFLYDYPAEKGSLARLRTDAGSLAERFELYIEGLELCNAYTELTDPSEQRRRFQEENDCRKRAGKTVYPLPDKFLDALHDMPEAAGNALGVDRLVMLFTNTDCIDEVVAFTPEEL